MNRTTVLINNAKELVKHENLTLVLERTELAKKDHIEVKVTDEGIIIKKWDNKRKEFTHCNLFLFSGFAEEEKE